MVTTKEILSSPEPILPGHAACAGCSSSLGLRYALKALGENVIMTIPACCTSVWQGPYPKSAITVPVLNIAFAAAASSASGVSAALEVKGKTDTTVLAWAGDGGSVDIGLATISGAAERNDNMIYVTYSNESYSNTGVQKSGATPPGARTTTTPFGRVGSPKDIALIMWTHHLPYVATACTSYPRDFIGKLRKAQQMKGFKFIYLLAPCAVGWRFPAEKTIEVGKLAVETGAHILWEAVDGDIELSPLSKKYKDPAKRKPLEEYLKYQGRYKGISKELVEAYQKYIDYQWSIITSLADIKK
ncbi:MAG: thiamine pyrophosphate-dependent enzyme [Candidatus Heimdallarchaeota archaeon]|nr:thiamine pyrophosphate-dependent enzyme [Candidatus Heimdallarchaeota archaeon]